MSSGRLVPVLQQLRTLTVEERSDRELLEAFTVTRDQAAFARLVERHGPAVLRVCRNVLRERHDAEDAFQATFLVLAQKAGSIRKAEAVPSWLHGVAYRAAMSAKRDSLRRRRREQQAKVPSPADPSWQAAWREVQGVVEEEIGRLPDPYRAPFVLCCLDGHSGAEAAVELGIKEPTLRTRLTKARKRLQERLARRGIVLSAVLATRALSKEGMAVGADLLTSTAEGAVRYATGLPVAASLVPESAVALARGVTKAMLVNRLSIPLGVALFLGLAAAGLAAHQQLRSPPTPPEPPTAQPERALAPVAPPDKASPVPAEEICTYAGRVLGPDGKPLAGARVWIEGLKPGVVEFRQRTTSGPDGTFRFQVRRDEFGDKGVVPPGRSPPERYVNLGATADGCGAACVWAGKREEREHLTLWLPAEEVAKGRVVSLECKPIAGVQISATIRHSRSAADHRPLPFDTPSRVGEYSGNILPDDRTTGVTDQDGRVTLRGLSRGWLYDLYISGPTIVHARAQLAARPDKPTVVGATGMVPPDRPRPQVTRFGSTFTYVAAPCKPIFGVVRDKKSGQPLAGFEVFRPFTRDDDPQASTTTDKDGRYRLVGLPAAVHTLQVSPPANVPYLTAEFRVIADQPGIEPVRFDIQLQRQPAVTGRVTDRASGKPVIAWVEYRPLASNPNLEKNPLLAQPRWHNHAPAVSTDRDGRYLLPALRGPGVLLVQAEGDYLPARLEKADRRRGITDRADPELIDCRPLLAWPEEYQGYRLIDVPEGKDARADIALTLGSRRPLVVVYPDGKPRDTMVAGLMPEPHDNGHPLYEAGKTFIAGLGKDEVRRIIVSTSDSQLAAVALVRGNRSGPVTVQLKPTGTIIGRVVDGNGKPVEGVSFQTLFDDGPGRRGVFVHGSTILRAHTAAESQRTSRTHGYYDFGLKVSRAERTDNLGRFRLTGLLADVPFDLQAQLVGPPNGKNQRFVTAEMRLARPTVKPGETLDLGDLRAVKK